jgi:hypothetical protein
MVQMGFEESGEEPLNSCGDIDSRQREENEPREWEQGEPSRDQSAARYFATVFDGIDPLSWPSQQQDTRPSGGHHPYARPVHSGWRRTPEGHWESTSEEDRQWEVVCEECGDTDGPVTMQSENVRILRGPYASRHKAEHSAKLHRKGTI